MAWKYSPCLKALELTSAILLSSPHIWIGMRDEVWRALCRRERKRRRRAAGIEVVELPLCVQLTDEVLSANIPTCLKARSCWITSKTSQPITIPASSRSFIESKLPILSLICGGHSYCHTTCGNGARPGEVMPPHPKRHASVYCRKCGGWGSKRRTGDGVAANW